MLFKFFILFITASVFATSPPVEDKTIRVGSKRFTENYIVAEIFSQLLEEKGFQVERKFGLGGTMVAYQALINNEIDIYPEYSGTAAAAILKVTDRDFDTINSKLIKNNVKMLEPLGFDNSYCTVMKKNRADELGIKNISDLTHHPELKAAFSFEFQERPDGWPSFKKEYNLKHSIRGIDIPLVYEALKNNEVDFAEAYSTEPLIKKYNFTILKDDKNFFPKYSAVGFVRKNFPKKAIEVLNLLNNQISNNKAITLNSLAVNKVPIEKIAHDFLFEKGFVKDKPTKEFRSGIDWAKMWERTQTHIYLTLLAVFFATLVAVPIGTLIAPYRKIAQPILGGAGILQTIPSIALLTFMIPFFGIGFLPAIVGLFIYSLLPILQNTYVAMTQIDPRLITAARGIGLYPFEVLIYVKWPLAFPTILTGIRTATILNIGTATLAAFIGAGGLGEPIVSGLALNDTTMVLQGAIPAALLAIVMDALFSLGSRYLTKTI